MTLTSPPGPNLFLLLLPCFFLCQVRVAAKQLFQEADQDQDGLLSAYELSMLLNRLHEATTIEEAGRQIQGHGVHDSCYLSFADFMCMMVDSNRGGLLLSAP
jgi:hypothetical protein